MKGSGAAPKESIELLGPALLDSERQSADAVLRFTRSLRMSLGWHYLLDLVWTDREMHAPPKSTVLDAGAGVGVMQWLLAERGVNVISVDRIDRTKLSFRFRARYKVRGLRKGDLDRTRKAIDLEAHNGTLKMDAVRDTRNLVGSKLGLGRNRGKVTIHRSVLSDLSAIPDASVDGIVSISSLEHNDLDDIPKVMQELWRVLRPGAVLTATVGAGKTDWYHEPSKGWCFSEATLRELFGLAPSTPSNYDQYDEILEAVRNNDELRKGLAQTYFTNGNNGMPWGKWDPQYLSVGFRRQKPG
jgi:ubiquinone/menaquinone biosynthesis C-methylase UbiE